MSLGMYMHAIGVPSCEQEGTPFGIAVYGVGGFCVARSTAVGNARALKCRTSDGYRFLRLFFFLIIEPSGSGNLRTS